MKKYILFLSIFFLLFGYGVDVYASQTMDENQWVAAQAMLPYATINAVTTSTVPKTVLSIPVSSNSNILVTAEVLSRRSDYANSYNGTVVASFTRGAGSVSRSGTVIRNLAGALGGIAYDLQANTATQSIDVVLTGGVFTAEYKLIIFVDTQN